jgi:hypothetical protein
LSPSRGTRNCRARRLRNHQHFHQICCCSHQIVHIEII